MFPIGPDNLQIRLAVLNRQGGHSKLLPPTDFIVRMAGATCDTYLFPLPG